MKNSLIKLPCVKGCTIYMGVWGTYNVRSQRFDFSAWAEALGEGTLAINFLRPGDSVPYPVRDVAIQGGVATWTFDATDTAAAGWGRVYLIYQAADARDATIDIPVCIAANSGPAGETPPEPLETWYEEMLAASQAAQDAAEAAVASLNKLPYPNPDTGSWWLWDATQGVYVDSGQPYGGGGGATDYRLLSHKPAINGVTLEGDLSGAELGIDRTYIYPQNTAADIWTVPHNLSKYPSVTVVDSIGRIVGCDVRYLDADTVQLSFAAPMIGTAYLN